MITRTHVHVCIVLYYKIVDSENQSIIIHVMVFNGAAKQLVPDLYVVASEKD